jgi:hypothetical protein
MKKVFVTIVSVVAAKTTQEDPFEMWGTYHGSTAAPAAPQGSGKSPVDDKPHVNVGGRFRDSRVKREVDTDPVISVSSVYNDGASNVAYQQVLAKQRASEKKYSEPEGRHTEGRQVPDHVFA